MPPSPQTSPPHDDEDSLPDTDADTPPPTPGVPQDDHASITSGHASPSQQRRDHHNTHTRRCRARLNWRFDALNNMLPHPPAAEVKHKVHILDHAISAFHNLRQTNAQLELMLALRSNERIVNWVDSFAHAAPDIVSALDPVVRLITHTGAWPYAEVWRLRERSTISMDSFCIACPPMLESTLLQLAQYSQRIVCGTTQEFVGGAFEMTRPAWTNACLDACRNEGRARLLGNARIRSAFAVPVPVAGEVTHVLAFYDVHERGRDAAHEEFASFASVCVGNCFGARQVENAVDM